MKPALSETEKLERVNGVYWKHSRAYLSETKRILAELDVKQIEELVSHLVSLRDRGGSLYVIGLGGSAANASHAVNDFRKLCGIEAYCLMDNVAELTARANDEGWHHIFNGQFWKKDHALLVLSVGGGTLNTSFPICLAIDKAKELGMKVFGIVGKDGGYTKNSGDCVIVIPTVEPSRVTPHTEAFQMVVLHCLFSHPDLQIRPTKW